MEMRKRKNKNKKLQGNERKKKFHGKIMPGNGQKFTK